MWLRSELKEHAKSVLNVNYWWVIAALAILMFASRGVNSVSFFNVSVSDPDMLDGFWEDGPMILGTFFVTAASMATMLNTAISAVLWCLVMNPLTVGIQRFLVRACRERAVLGEIMSGFSKSYKNIVKIMFFRNLYTFLWSMLFVVPGIIKAYEYRMIPFILTENPDIRMEDAFALSKKMMDNEKLNAFVLDISFIGWMILGAFSCGIFYIFYVNPYYQLTNAELYLVLKQKISR